MLTVVLIGEFDPVKPVQCNELQLLDREKLPEESSPDQERRAVAAAFLVVGEHGLAGCVQPAWSAQVEGQSCVLLHERGRQGHCDGFPDGAVEDGAFPGVVLHRRDDLEGLTADVKLAKSVMAVVAGRADAADFTDIAAVPVATGADEIQDFMARQGRYGAQQRAGISRRGEKRVDGAELLQAAPVFVGAWINLLDVTVEHYPLDTVLAGQEQGTDDRRFRSEE